MQVAGCRVQGAGCRMQGAGCRVQGAGCRNEVFGLNCGVPRGRELFVRPRDVEVRLWGLVVWWLGFGVRGCGGAV